MNFEADPPEWICVNHKRKYRCELFHNDKVGKVRDIIDLSILYIPDTAICHRNIEKLQKSLFPIMRKRRHATECQTLYLL